MSLYDKASLVMIPSGYKEDKLYSIKPTSGDGDFTFSRGTDTATRVNASGLIEKERGNLVLQSNSFDTTWLPSSAISATGGQSGYDGSSDAWLLKRSDSAARYLSQNITLGSAVHTYSVYAKAESENWLYIWSYDGSVSVNAYFDLSGSGAVGTTSGLIDANIESVENGWFRCSITYNDNISSVRLYPAVADGSITGGITDAGIYIQDAQLEQGLVATDYIETTTAAVYEGITDNLPRLDYSGGASCPSLLLEPQRTNLIEQSEYFSASTWVGTTGGTLTENDTTSPEGVVNATKFEGDGSSSSIRLYDFQNFASAGDYSLSFFAKAGTADFIQISLLGYDGGGQASFDLSNGTIDDVANGSIEDYGNGWYRCTCIKSIGATDLTGSANLYVRKSLTANWDNAAEANGKYVYIYGAQLESGSYATSYIPTYGTSATRAVDDLSDSTFTALPNANFTIFFEVEEWAGSEGNNYQIRFLDASGNRNVQFRNRPEGWRWLITNDAGGAAYLNAGNYTYTKMACRYNGTNYQLFADGSAVGSPFSASDTAVLDSFESFGIGIMGIKQMLCFPTALTNAELASLTTI